MKFFAILALSFHVVAAATMKKEDQQESKRTGRQFGWQTPYYPLPSYDHVKFYGQNYQNSMQPGMSSVEGSLAQQNIKMENHLGTILELAATKKQPSIELKLKPSKVNASLSVTRSHGKSKPPVIEPAYSTPHYPPQSFYGYGYPNYYQQQQQIQNFYDNKQSYPMSTPIIPSNQNSESNFGTYNPNYLGMGYNSGYGQYPTATGHPSFGVQGQYTPSGGVLGNYNYFNTPVTPAVVNQPTHDYENNFENVIPDGLQYKCPLDFSGSGHVVGQATIYPDPSKCNRFYYCHNSNAYVFQCTDGLFYNPDIKACDENKYFSCGNRSL